LQRDAHERFGSFLPDLLRNLCKFSVRTERFTESMDPCAKALALGAMAAAHWVGCRRKGSCPGQTGGGCCQRGQGPRKRCEAGAALAGILSGMINFKDFWLLISSMGKCSFVPQPAQRLLKDAMETAMAERDELSRRESLVKIARLQPPSPQNRENRSWTFPYSQKPTA